MRMVTVVKKHRTTVILLAVLLIVVGTVLTTAMAQPGPQADGDDAGQRDGRDFRAMMMRGGGSEVALAVSGDSVFLFARNTLYKFDAETLELVAQTELPRPQRPQDAPQ